MSRNANLPIEALRNFDEPIEWNKIKWDPNRAGKGLQVETKDQLTVVSTLKSQYRTVFATEGYDSGIHYYQVSIDESPSTTNIFIGWGNANNNNLENYIGAVQDDVGWNGANGNIYSSANRPWAQPFKKGDTIGSLLNLRHRTVTYFKNGELVGTAVGSDTIKTGPKYFPAITLFDENAKLTALLPEQSQGVSGKRQISLNQDQASGNQGQVSGKQEPEKVNSWTAQSNEQVQISGNSWTAFPKLSITFEVSVQRQVTLFYNVSLSTSDANHFCTRLLIDSKEVEGSRCITGNTPYHTNTISMPYILGTGSHRIALEYRTPSSSQNQQSDWTCAILKVE